MGTIGGLVVPLILAAAIGFAVGWFFARAGRKPEGAGAGEARTLVEDVGTGSADTDQRVALLEADYARRVEVFSKREAELITAGRKVVEQLRRREAELAGQRGDASSIDPALSPRAVERSSPETAEVPVAAAAAIAVFEAIEKKGLLAEATRIEKTLKRELERLQKSHDIIGEIRGMGAMIAVEFVQPGTGATTKKPNAAVVSAISKYAFEHGVILLTAGTNGNVIRFLPSLVISDAQLLDAVSVIEDALATL